MRVAKTIDELYEEVMDYDLVLCNDAPLALALGNRVRRPMIGVFSITPRQLAGDVALRKLRTGMISDIRLVKLISKYTGYDIRFVHGEVDNILRMRRHTGDVRPHLGKRGKRIYDELIELPTLDRVMWEFNAEEDGIFDGLKVAVIGGDLYDDLDKHFNPKFGTYAEISPFRKGDYRIKEIRELGNDRQVAENAVSLINLENAEDVAIVMDVGGNIADAVRSALYRKGIPFINTLSVKDLHSVRDFLEFLSLSLSFDIVRVKHVRELISSYGGFISSRYDEYMLSQYPKALEAGERTSELTEIMRNVREMTFLEVCEKAVRRGKDSAQVKILLDEMELTDDLVDASKVADIAYAVNNIGNLKHSEQIPENEKKGVLLVDCQKSVYIDRPFVIYLGMGQEWEKDPNEIEFLNAGQKADEREKDALRFQILMQQGTARVYICNSSRRGNRPAPCVMFGQAEDNKTFLDFKEVCDDLVTDPWYVPDEAEQPRIGCEVIGTDFIPKPFSKSSYGRFVECPRKFMFSTITRMPDKDATVRGTMIHSFAEFKVCYPEKVMELGLDYFADEIASVCAGLSSPEKYNIERSEIMSHISGIDAAVDLIGAGVPKLEAREEDTRNHFMKKLGLNAVADFSEIKCTSGDGLLEGIFDLLWDGTVYDFKTGKPSDAAKIRARMDRGNKKEYKDYQPLFYLTLLDELFPGSRGEFRLFFSKEGSMNAAKGSEYDTRAYFRTVRLINDKRELIQDYIAETVANVKTYSVFSHCQDAIAETTLELGPENITENGSEALIRVVLSSGMKDCKTLRRNVQDLAKRIAKKLSDDIIKMDSSTVLVTRKALEGFRTELMNDMERLCAMYSTNHPAEPLQGCKHCDFVDICTAEPVEGGETDV
ncbi:MAG: PD-(D/E)XK nuclease family protein [Thermoplasmatales archaeon]|nr:PD-(D/E)XK nuclease family protein [Thermoplasmatales archaeon]